MPRPISQRCRDKERAALAGIETPRPVTEAERAAFEAESREAMRMAREFGTVHIPASERSTVRT